MTSVYHHQSGVTEPPEVGALLRYHRRAAGLTQVELARLAGVGKSTVYAIEKGKLAVQLDKFAAILRVLSITLRYEGPLVSEYEKSQSAAGQPAGR